ncbi:hypothetical protein [Candidatus Aciduliprofundum boonei]|nr:hypothetical protein [Candidatus Aciduliprofundum boonei]
MPDEEWDKILDDIENFKKDMEKEGFPHFVDKAAEILLRIYSTNKILIRDISIPAHTPENQNISPILAVLFKLGYIKEVESKRYHTQRRYLFGELTPKGLKTAKALSLKILRDFERIIDWQINRCGKIIAFMICTALNSKNGSGGKGLKVDSDYVSKGKYENALLSDLLKISPSGSFYGESKDLKIPLSIQIFLKSSIKLPAVADEIMNAIVEYCSGFLRKNLLLLSLPFPYLLFIYILFLH